MAELKGGEGDQMRIRHMQSVRDKERKEFQDNINKLQEESKVGLIPMEKKFSGMSSSVAEQLKANTVGLVTLEDFRKKRQFLETEEGQIEEKKRLEALKQKPKKSKIQSSKLSFDFEDENQEEEVSTKKEIKKITKDPTVETSFLPDKEREELEKQQREKLTLEWLETQEKIKGEDLELSYIYYDRNLPRNKITVKKGDTIQTFIAMTKKSQPELKSVNENEVMFIKEDRIIPGHVTFYDLLTSELKGKNGSNVFQFEVNEEKSTSLPSSDKEDPNIIKLVERSWYQKNSYIFPMDRWEVFDPEIKK